MKKNDYNKKRVLYIGAMGMGDAVLSIPFLLNLRSKGYHITLLKYHPKYFGKKLFYSLDDITNFLKINNLFDDVLYIPYNKFRFFIFVIKNLFKFDIAYVPIKTFFTRFWGYVLGKKSIFMFKNLNDTSYYSGIIQGMLQKEKIKSLFFYKKYLSIPKDPSYKDKFGINGKFVTLFPSIFERSINVSERAKIVSFFGDCGLSVIIVGGNRENWLYDGLKKHKFKHIINLCGKTDFIQILNILSDSTVNVSANGGIMWLGHLLNRYNVSFHLTSGYITEPPVDNIHSFNIRKYKYPGCKPCEPDTYKNNGIKGIPCCVFAGTKREGECRKSINGEDIIKYIKKII